MLRRSTGKQAAMGIILTWLIFAGCGSQGRTLEFAFDGNECTYSGPKKVSAREITLVFNNRNQEPSGVDFGRLEGDKTWDDLLSYNGPSASPSKGRPSWFKDATFTSVPAGQSETRELSVTSGTWATVCHNNRQIWPGAPLTVE